MVPGSDSGSAGRRGESSALDAGLDGPTHDDAALAEAAFADARTVVGSASRLDVLRSTGLLDTASEESFDRLTRLAVHLVGAPAAFVSLVDEWRDFYKSACGLPEPIASAREMRGPTFCHLAVRGTAPLVVRDAAADPLFRAVPTVRTLGVAAYVGVPIVIDGEAVGAFCTIDTRPRDWTGREVEVLTELAASAQREIALRLAVRRGEALAAAAERGEQRVTAVLESISDAFFALDRDWRFTYVNDRAEQVLFRPRAGLLGRPVWEELAPAAGSAFGAMFRRAVRTGQAVSFEEHYAPLDGWLEVRAYPGPEGLAVYFSDITERRLASQALRESEARFRAVQDASPDGSLLGRAVRDGSGAVVDFSFIYANAAAHRILFGDDSPIVGRLMSEAFPQAMAEGRFAEYVRVVETGELWQRDVFHSTAGVPRGLRVTAVKVDDGVHIALADLTDRLRAANDRERALATAERARADAERARGDAEAANAVKAQFLATMSHELRTPLNAIGGYAQLMELGVRGPVTPEQRSDLARIQASQKHLLGLINSVLNYAKLEAGTVQYDIAPVPLAATVRTVESLVGPQMRGKGLAYAFEPCDDGISARADAEKVRQVLLNLLTNAVKFTPAGGRVTICCGDTGDVGGEVWVRVEDTGVGIAPEKLESAFDPFVQVGRQLTTGDEGVGLGLAISRDLARGMGGELSATSAPGVGSVFTLRLPRAEPRAVIL